MANLLYTKNPNEANRYTQVEFTRDNGSQGSIELGKTYSDLSTTEVAFLRQFAVLVDASTLGAGAGGAGSGIESLLFSQATAVIAQSGAYRVRSATRSRRISLNCLTAPQGSSLVVHVLRNGAQISSLSLAAGSLTEQVDVVAYDFLAGDRVSVATVSVGSSSPATGVMLQVDLG